MQKMIVFAIVAFIIMHSGLSLADTLDDTVTVKEIASQVAKTVPLGGARNVRFKLVSINRIYEQLPRGSKVAIFFVYYVVEERDLRGRQEEIRLIYEWMRYDWRRESGKFQGVWGKKLDGEKEYRQRIADLDRSSQYRIVSRDVEVPTLTSALQEKPKSAQDIVLYAKTRGPTEIAARDADVIAAKKLLRDTPRTHGLSGDEFRTAAEARRRIFLQTHYHVGRIEIRRAASAKAGRLAEKEKLLQEAVRKWASNLDTHSMAPPKPTMESILVLEPAEEAFARHLAEAYDRQLVEIHQQLNSLLRLIAVDAESPWAFEESKRIVESLPVKAQDEKDRGRKSLGGEPQVDEFARSLGRVVAPVLAELGKTESAQTPSDALAKLVEALAKAESGIAADATRENHGKP